MADDVVFALSSLDFSKESDEENNLLLLSSLLDVEYDRKIARALSSRGDLIERAVKYSLSLPLSKVEGRIGFQTIRRLLGWIPEMVVLVVDDIEFVVYLMDFNCQNPIMESLFLFYIILKESYGTEIDSRVRSSLSEIPKLLQLINFAFESDMSKEVCKVIFHLNRLLDGLIIAQLAKYGVSNPCILNFIQLSIEEFNRSPDQACCLFLAQSLTTMNVCFYSNDLKILKTIASRWLQDLESDDISEELIDLNGLVS